MKVSLGGSAGSAGTQKKFAFRNWFKGGIENGRVNQNWSSENPAATLHWITGIPLQFFRKFVHHCVCEMRSFFQRSDFAIFFKNCSILSLDYFVVKIVPVSYSKMFFVLSKCYTNCSSSRGIFCNITNITTNNPFIEGIVVYIIHSKVVWKLR